MNTPKTIRDYLDQLRAALANADPALVQDALYDAEDHLRSELAENPGKSEADMLAKIANSYGAPSEVAAIYVEQERVVEQALRPPPPPRRRSVWGRFFGVVGDARAYAALFYMLLSLPIGIFCFVFTVVGLSLSLGLSVLVVGLVVPIAFVGALRVLALVEGRVIEVLLGERMPRRPVYADRARPWRQRIAAMFTDPRTWSTMLYMLLKLPIGIVYFTIAVAGTVTSLALIFAPVAELLSHFGAFDGNVGIYVNGDTIVPPLVVAPVAFVIGAIGLFAMLHVARGVGRLQGALAKHLLVPSSR